MNTNRAVFQMPARLITGTGSLSLIGGEARNLGAARVLVLADPAVGKHGHSGRLMEQIETAGMTCDVWDEIGPEPPFELLEQISARIRGKGYDLFIGIGGGSVLDVTKVLAVMHTNPEPVRDLIGTDKIARSGLPFILVPTTAGTGSEVTNIAIFTDSRDNVKKGIVSRYLLASVSIVDAALTLSVPPRVTAATGMDALVHAIESYTSVRAGVLTDGIALNAIKLISHSLRRAVFDGNNVKAREDMAMGSLLAGMSFGNAGVGAVHALAYPLGGRFKVPHGVANSLLLPFVMKYNAVANLEKFTEVAKALGEQVEGMSLRESADIAISSMERLAADIGIPPSLRDVGVQACDIPQLAEEAGQIDRLLQNNPRRLTIEEIEQIYRDAYNGRGA